MKLNIANPLTGAQAMVEIEDDRKLAVLYDRRIAQEVPGDELGEEFKGYVFKITGGCDKQGFPMKQGVLVPHRVRLLLGKQPGFWRPNRDGATRRRSVRGCIVASDIAALNLVLVKQGETPLPALERVLPRRLGPKRASKIRKLFNLSKKDDVRKYVVRRELPGKPKDKKPRTKAPKIQRLITPRMLQHKRHILALKKRWSAKSRADAAEYAALLSARKAEKLAKAKSHKSSERKSEKKAAAAAAAGTAAPAKAAGKAAAKPAKAAAPAAKPAAAAAPAVVAAASGAAKKKKASGKK